MQRAAADLQAIFSSGRGTERFTFGSVPVPVDGLFAEDYREDLEMGGRSPVFTCATASLPVGVARGTLCSRVSTGIGYRVANREDYTLTMLTRLVLEEIG